MKQEKPLVPENSKFLYEVGCWFRYPGKEAVLNGKSGGGQGVLYSAYKSKGIQDRYVHLVQRMDIYGLLFIITYARSLKGGLFALRINSGEGAVRFFYCTIV